MGRWGSWGTGCNCCGECGSICVTATGCNGAILSGATVTVKDAGNVTVGTCTTAGSPASCCVPITAAGTYTVTVSGLTMYATKTQSVTATCATNNVTVSLVTATGYACSSCCQGFPIPSTLHAADDTTSGIVMTFDGPTATWVGCHTFSSDNVFKCVDNVNSHVTDQVAVVYKLKCNAGRNPIAWELTVSWYAAVFTDFLGNKFSGLYKSILGAGCTLTPQAPAGDNCSFPNRLDNIFTWDATSTCNPLNLVFNLPATVGSGFPTPTSHVYITL
jgi:hypothetical protein